MRGTEFLREKEDDSNEEPGECREEKLTREMENGISLESGGRCEGGCKGRGGS